MSLGAALVHGPRATARERLLPLQRPLLGSVKGQLRLANGFQRDLIHVALMFLQCLCL